MAIRIKVVKRFGIAALPHASRTRNLFGIPIITRSPPSGAVGLSLISLASEGKCVQILFQACILGSAWAGISLEGHWCSEAAPMSAAGKDPGRFWVHEVEHITGSRIFSPNSAMPFRYQRSPPYEFPKYCPVNRATIPAD